LLLSGRKPGQETTINRRLIKAFEEITIARKVDPAVFAFNHNGVTLFAEMIEGSEGAYRITEPRLLNGAQTLGSFNAFINSHKDAGVLAPAADRLDAIKVMCKVITQSDQDFVTTVTICNNRQNPVAPWNGKLIAIFNAPEVMKKRVEYALLPGGWRDRDALEKLVLGLP
jgi:hypothetical protein